MEFLSQRLRNASTYAAASMRWSATHHSDARGACACECNFATAVSLLLSVCLPAKTCIKRLAGSWPQQLQCCIIIQCRHEPVKITSLFRPVMARLRDLQCDTISNCLCSGSRLYLKEWQLVQDLGLQILPAILAPSCQVVSDQASKLTPVASIGSDRAMMA